MTIIEAQPAVPHPAAAVALPMNYWIDGQFSNPLNLETYEYTTLAQMFARDVTTPAVREYVSPDGSLVLPAWRVFRQGRMDRIQEWTRPDGDGRTRSTRTA